MAKYRVDVAAVAAEMIGVRSKVESRVTFGVPGYLVGGKMFACVNHSGIGLKLPVGTIDALTGPEFGPFGRPGRLGADRARGPRGLPSGHRLDRDIPRVRRGAGGRGGAQDAQIETRSWEIGALAIGSVRRERREASDVK